MSWVWQLQNKRKYDDNDDDNDDDEDDDDVVKDNNNNSCKFYSYWPRVFQEHAARAISSKEDF